MGWVFAILGILSGIFIGVFGFRGEYVEGASIFIPMCIVVGGVIHQLCKIRRALEQQNDASSRSSRPPGDV